MVSGVSCFWCTIDRIAHMQRTYQVVRGQQSAFWSLKSAIQRAEAASEVIPGGTGPVPKLTNGITFQHVCFCTGKSRS